jgi:hypothetical protein
MASKICDGGVGGTAMWTKLVFEVCGTFPSTFPSYSIAVVFAAIDG